MVGVAIGHRYRGNIGSGQRISDLQVTLAAGSMSGLCQAGGPPRWGGCANQKLSEKKCGGVQAVGELESGAQCGSAVNAVYFMERSCPMSSGFPAGAARSVHV
jgi:hypothetical protein